MVRPAQRAVGAPAGPPPGPAQAPPPACLRRPVRPAPAVRRARRRCSPAQPGRTSPPLPSPPDLRPRDGAEREAVPRPDQRAPAGLPRLPGLRRRRTCRTPFRRSALPPPGRGSGRERPPQQPPAPPQRFPVPPRGHRHPSIEWVRPRQRRGKRARTADSHPSRRRVCRPGLPGKPAPESRRKEKSRNAPGRFQPAEFRPHPRPSGRGRPPPRSFRSSGAALRQAAPERCSRRHPPASSAHRRREQSGARRSRKADSPSPRRRFPQRRRRPGVPVPVRDRGALPGSRSPARPPAGRETRQCRLEAGRPQAGPGLPGSPGRQPPGGRRSPEGSWRWQSSRRR